MSFRNMRKQAGAELGHAELKLELGLLHCIDYYLSLNTISLYEDLPLLSSPLPPCHPCHTSLPQAQVTQNDRPYYQSTIHCSFIVLFQLDLYFPKWG